MSDDLSLFGRVRQAARDLRDRVIGEPDQAVIQTVLAGSWDQDSTGEKQSRTLIAHNSDGTYLVAHQQGPVGQEPDSPVWGEQPFATRGEAEQHAGLWQHNWQVTREREIQGKDVNTLDADGRGKELTDTTARARWEREVDVVNGSTLTDEDKKRAIGELGPAPPITVGEERDGLSMDGRQMSRLNRQAEIAIEDTAPDKGIGFSQDLQEHQRTQDQNASLGLEL